MKKLCLIVAQIGLLFLINTGGHLVTELMRLPLPGNLLGMLFLLALLMTGALRLEWIERGATFLMRHLAFFFVPIAVGLMGFADLIVANGVAILLTLVVSAGIGIYLAGFCSQILSTKMRKGAP